MPGRLSIYDDNAFKQEIAEKFGTFKDNIGILHKRYNIAPTIDIPIYTNEGVYTYAHFALIPSWAQGKGSMQINARSETVFEKNSFKEAYKARRCLIPVNGYFEWKKDTTSKKSQPYLIQSATSEYMVFAGIYEWWYDNALKKPILTCALLTTQPNETIATLHDRMPVILKERDWKLWLSNDSNYSQLNSLYIPFASEEIKYFSVSDVVNSVRNDSLDCIKEVNTPLQMTLF